MRLLATIQCLVALAAYPLPSEASKAVVLETIYFPADSSEPSTHEQKKLDRVLCALDGRGVAWVAAEGHAATDEGQPVPLSLARAELTLQKLESKGLRANERHLHGKGAMQPVAGSDTYEDRRKNGRVEIEVGYVIDGRRHAAKCE